MSQPIRELRITKDERTWAMAAHALTFVEGGILGPLILYFLKKDESAFVAFHALQSLMWGLLFAVISAVVVAPLTLCTFGVGALLLFAVIPVYLIFEILALVKANEGEWYLMPIVGDWCYERHPPGSGPEPTESSAP